MMARGIETLPSRCPECGESMLGEPIPDGHREHYGDSTHFFRVLPVYDSRHRVASWQCPDCGYVWPRDLNE